MGGNCIALIERYPPRDPVVEGHTILVAQLSVERQALLKPGVYDRLITLGGNEPQGRLFEATGNASLVVQLPVHRQPLLEQGASSAVLSLYADNLRQGLEGPGDGIFVAHLPGEREALFQQRTCGCKVSPLPPGYPGELRKDGRA